MPPICPSLIWDDLYTLTMSQAVFLKFPTARVRMTFTDREPDRSYPADMVPKLREQVRSLAELQLQRDEFTFLSGIRFVQPHYLEWLSSFRFDPGAALIEIRDGRLHMEIEDLWYKAAWWEMKLLLTTSTLANGGAEPAPWWKDRIAEKGNTLAAAKCNWIDFGTRRAFSPAVQDEVVRLHKRHTPFFRGTSNMYLAMKHGVTPTGTVAHQWFMGMQARYGIRAANYEAMECWSDRAVYGGDLGIALTDTLTTEIFLRSLTRKQAKLWDGFRLDSGDLLNKAKLIARFIQRTYDIDPCAKVWTPSDSLNIEKTIAFRDGLATFLNNPKVKVTAGIGTFIVNDCGYKPRSIVIKPIAFNFGHGWQNVCKLSDTRGKHMGDPAVIRRAYEELHIPETGWDDSLSIDQQMDRILASKETA